MKTILITNYVSVHHAVDEKVLEIKWLGVIPLKDCQIAFTTVKKHLSKNYHLILNNSLLEGFNRDTRVWLKTSFIREEMQTVAPILATIANIHSKSSVQAFLSALNHLASVLYPNIKMKSFLNAGDAFDWTHHQRLKYLLKEVQPFNESNLSLDLNETEDLPVIGSLMQTLFR